MACRVEYEGMDDHRVPVLPSTAAYSLALQLSACSLAKRRWSVPCPIPPPHTHMHTPASALPHLCLLWPSVLRCTHCTPLAVAGDSRAVLSRGGVAVQVTDDHKPEREDEAVRSSISAASKQPRCPVHVPCPANCPVCPGRILWLTSVIYHHSIRLRSHHHSTPMLDASPHFCNHASRLKAPSRPIRRHASITCAVVSAACVQERVEKAGGQVLYWNGHRVMGVLAMSRAIGDHCLRPYVIPEPEVCHVPVCIPLPCPLLPPAPLPQWPPTTHAPSQ